MFDISQDDQTTMFPGFVCEENAHFSPTMGSPIKENPAKVSLIKSSQESNEVDKFLIERKKREPLEKKDQNVIFNKADKIVKKEELKEEKEQIIGNKPTFKVPNFTFAAKPLEVKPKPNFGLDNRPFEIKASVQPIKTPSFVPNFQVKNTKKLESIIEKPKGVFNVNFAKIGKESKALDFKQQETKLDHTQFIPLNIQPKNSTIIPEKEINKPSNFALPPPKAKINPPIPSFNFAFKPPITTTQPKLQLNPILNDPQISKTKNEFKSFNFRPEPWKNETPKFNFMKPLSSVSNVKMDEKEKEKELSEYTNKKNEEDYFLIIEENAEEPDEGTNQKFSTSISELSNFSERKHEMTETKTPHNIIKITEETIEAHSEVKVIISENTNTIKEEKNSINDVITIVNDKILTYNLVLEEERIKQLKSVHEELENKMFEFQRKKIFFLLFHFWFSEEV